MMEESFPAEKPAKSSERYDKSINLKHLKEESPLLCQYSLHTCLLLEEQEQFSVKRNRKSEETVL